MIKVSAIYKMGQKVIVQKMGNPYFDQPTLVQHRSLDRPIQIVSVPSINAFTTPMGYESYHLTSCNRLIVPPPILDHTRLNFAALAECQVVTASLARGAGAESLEDSVDQTL